MNCLRSKALSFGTTKKVVKVSIISAIIRALHSVTKSFLTATLSAITIAVSGLDWFVQSQSGYKRATCYQRVASFVKKLAAGVGLEPTCPEGLIRFSVGSVDHSGNPPLIQSSPLLPCSRLLRRHYLNLGRGACRVNPLIRLVVRCRRGRAGIASLYQSLQDYVNGRQRVLIPFQVITRRSELVPNLGRSQWFPSGLQRVKNSGGKAALLAGGDVLRFRSNVFRVVTLAQESQAGHRFAQGGNSLIYLRALHQQIAQFLSGGLERLAVVFALHMEGLYTPVIMKAQ